MIKYSILCLTSWLYWKKHARVWQLVNVVYMYLDGSILLASHDFWPALCRHIYTLIFFLWFFKVVKIFLVLKIFYCLKTYCYIYIWPLIYLFVLEGETDSLLFTFSYFKETLFFNFLFQTNYLINISSYIRALANLEWQSPPPLHLPPPPTMKLTFIRWGAFTSSTNLRSFTWVCQQGELKWVLPSARSI